MRKSTQRKIGLQWGLIDRLEDLDYADDICLLTHSFQHMKEKCKELEIEARKAGLKINSRKTKEMRLFFRICYGFSTVDRAAQKRHWPSLRAT